MSARSIASATVSFGMVAIPVKLFSTGESSSGVRFNRIHKKCGGRIKQQSYCPQDDEVVKNDELVKGYEFAKGQYVLFSDEELKQVTAKATQTIEIAEFLPAEKVDPIFFEGSYYLGPDKGGERPYRLLAETMRATSRSALARYAARGKEYLVLLRPFQEGLLMQQLRYADEVRSFSEVPLGDVELKQGELDLARQLVDHITSDEFKPENYEDGVKKRILEVIQQKVEGQEVQMAPAEEPKAQVIDLMEALKASLDKQASAGSEETGRKPPRRAPRRAAKVSKAAKASK